MRSAGLLVAVLLPLVLSGCADGSDSQVAAADAVAPTTLRLQCLGLDGGIPALETSFLDSCWGHIGHHTYFVEEPVALVALTGQVFPVEVAYTTLAGHPALPVELSLDGRQWTTVGTIPYPLGEDASDRYEVQVDLPNVAMVPFRFLRVSMPLSAHDGLAGYLDGSNLTAYVLPLADAPPLEPTAGGTCSDGDVMEDFFAEHPCWFGGMDAVDRALGGSPRLGQVAISQTEESWYDSPSFLHTYVVGGGPGGPFQASVTAQLWRVGHYAGRCSALDPLNASTSTVILAQASPDGALWAEVARSNGGNDEPILLEGTLPDGSMFLRFGGERGASWDFGGCHHPQSFLVESSFTIG